MPRLPRCCCLCYRLLNNPPPFTIVTEPNFALPGLQAIDRPNLHRFIPTHLTTAVHVAVEAALSTALEGYVPETRTINGLSLEDDIVIPVTQQLPSLVFNGEALTFNSLV